MKELTREMFEARAGGGGIVPVYREYLADMETPVSVLSRAVDEDVFLLESVASSETGGRYSFLGVNPYATVYEKDGTVFMQTPADGVSFLPDADILAALRRLFAERNFKADPDLPPNGISASTPTCRRSRAARSAISPMTPCGCSSRACSSRPSRARRLPRSSSPTRSSCSTTCAAP